jgi:hypothetical protein
MDNEVEFLNLFFKHNREFNENKEVKVLEKHNRFYRVVKPFQPIINKLN